MTNFHHSTPEQGSRINNIVIGALTAAMIVLAGVLSVGQFVLA